MNIYTFSERTVKKYSVGGAVESAKRRLNGLPICTDAIRSRTLSDRITLQELNEIADAIVEDSIHYDSF